VGFGVSRNELGFLSQSVIPKSVRLVIFSRATKLDPVIALAPTESCTFDANSGEHTLAACWSRHSAETNFPFRLNSFGGVAKKFAIAKCDRQHAASVRSPDFRVHA
jgi:hypothetical protein